MFPNLYIGNRLNLPTLNKIFKKEGSYAYICFPFSRNRRKRPEGDLPCA